MRMRSLTEGPRNKTMSTMQKRPFGRTGLLVSPVGLGAAPIGLLNTDQDRIGKLLNLLLDSGVNFIDTAANYAGSEEAIGKAVSHRRDEFVLISKCGQEFPDLPGRMWSRELITATIDRSLKRLKTDRIDAVLLHSCDMETLQKGEALEALVAARQAGKIRFAGYSGDNEVAATAAAHPEVAVVETSINITDQANIDVVLPVAAQHNVGVIAKRPIANAAWKLLSDQPGFYQNYAKPYHDRLKAMDLHLEDLSLEPVPSDWLEVALRFTLSIEGVHAAIVGTTSPDNAKRNIEIAAMPPLPADGGAKDSRGVQEGGEGEWGEVGGVDLRRRPRRRRLVNLMTPLAFCQTENGAPKEVNSRTSQAWR
jgi:aryl-alcohol dehydrogenase-like predicted oxidoreductase